MHVEWALPIWGWPLLAAIAACGVFWTRHQYARTQPSVARPLRRWLITLRCAALVILLVACAGPSLFRVHAEDRPAEIVVVVEDSGSMALTDGPADQSRWDLALDLATAIDSICAQQPEKVRVHLLRGNGLLATQELVRSAGAASPPTAVGSDHQALLRDIGSQWADRPLRGVVVVGDGNDTSPAGTGEVAAANLGTAKLLTVGVGDATGPPDRAIQDLRYPEMAFAGEEIVVEVTVIERSTAGEGDRRVTARLREGGDLLAETTAEAAPDGVTHLELSFRPQVVGLHALELEIPALANERYLENNRATLAISVHKERTRLLLLAGRPGWDARFLAQAARREERLQLDIVYAGRDGLVLADSAGAWRPPQGTTAWREWDALILTGWEAMRRLLDWPRLAEAVAAGTGLFVLMNDEDGPPPVRRQGTVVAPPVNLAAALPVALEAARWSEGDWVLQPTPQSGRHFLLEGVTYHGITGLEQSLDKLPPLVRLVDAVTKPGSTTLLAAKPRMAEQEAVSQPILVVGQYGAGHVAWFGGRRLWELAFWEAPGGQSSEAEQPARRLVRNLLVWVAAGDEAGGLSLLGHRKVYQEGERIRLQAQWRDSRGDSLVPRPLVLRLQPLDEEAGFGERLFTMDPVPGEGDRAEIILPPLPPGRYAVRPESSRGAPVIGRQDHLVVSPISLEQTQVRQDRRFLRHLAALWGGTYLAGESEAAVPHLGEALEDLDLSGDTRINRRRWNIWAGWPLLILFATLLGTEWSLRRRHGLL